MKKTKQTRNKEKLMPTLGMMPMFKGNQPIIMPLDKTVWAVTVSTKKPTVCGSCNQDLKPCRVGVVWNSENDYLALTFLGFDDRLLGLRLVKFFGRHRAPICLGCLADNT